MSRKLTTQFRSDIPFGLSTYSDDKKRCVDWYTHSSACRTQHHRDKTKYSAFLLTEPSFDASIGLSAIPGRPAEGDDSGVCAVLLLVDAGLNPVRLLVWGEEIFALVLSAAVAVDDRLRVKFAMQMK